MAIKNWKNLEPEWLQAEGIKLKFGIPKPYLEHLAERKLVRRLRLNPDETVRSVVTYSVADVRKWCNEAAAV